MNSTTAASARRASPRYPSAPQESSSSAGRRRLPPADELVDAPQIVRDRRQHGHEAHDSLIILGFSGSGQLGARNQCTQSSSPAASSIASNPGPSSVSKRSPPRSAPTSPSR